MQLNKSSLFVANGEVRNNIPLLHLTKRDLPINGWNSNIEENLLEY